MDSSTLMTASLSLQFFSRTPISSSSNPSNHKNFSANAHSPSLPTTTTTNPQFPVLSNPAVKVPTPPWMKGPLLLQPHELLNLTKPTKKTSSKTPDLEKTDKPLTAKESGVRGKKAMVNIVKHIEMLQENENSLDSLENHEEFDIGEGLGKLGGDGGESSLSKTLPWEKEEKFVYPKIKKEKVISKAELSLDRELLERLRSEAAVMKNWVKVMKLGVTQDVVDEIRFSWRRNELAMVKFDLPLSRNMKRAREILELKTGGLVIWKRKVCLFIYRGSNYHLTKSSYPRTRNDPTQLKDEEDDDTKSPIKGSLFERETDRLLNGLGPRFVDWWMSKPLPVDADLLPEVIPGFLPPSRLCPSISRPKLKDEELTYLRKVAYALPTHFVLGRNRRLQGLAAAILKLWQKSTIAKISVKWGIPNTNNEAMANELKYLTGGVLLLRDKFYIILYRGKDFIPNKVAPLIVERETELKRCLSNEEDARLNALETFYITDEPSADTKKIGTLDEFQDMEVKFGEPVKGKDESILQLEAEKKKLEMELRNQEHRLSIVRFITMLLFVKIPFNGIFLQQESKMEKSARELSKLNSSYVPAELEADLEMITDEERECFRKIGMKMHSYLVLGRRGIFDGVMEGLHQHWKFREVIKVISKQRTLEQVICTAKLLEAESGGVLVSVEKIKEVHAIIIYRGKNYKRPPKLPRNLLNKKEALSRSLEMQRVGLLKFFSYKRQRTITELKLKLAQLQEAEEKSLKNSDTMR